MADRSERLPWDLALQAAAGRGDAKLSGHRRLYELSARRQWVVLQRRLKVIGLLPAVA